MQNSLKSDRMSVKFVFVVGAAIFCEIGNLVVNLVVNLNVNCTQKIQLVVST